ncbi:PD-(D/E)XK nuclease-like domain-containing protein [Mycobacterium sp. TY815]|uniref:PD-(D/E)XK nuclease-like domain-containing protein n=1 Tax=Mycobacterium sp. TY815 TaxID=3050581 RepID=UPI002741B426|nr:PD-(D/E)XK nuclease-like domain-containing protein [Mycobacterium sp. TY815]MDP7706831.1 PD-(D/E)XK nuclease-like domain-containing protein [Mycobacterium sp. TY815]
MTVPRQDGLYPGVSEQEYHGDKDSLSSSGARLLLSTSPAEFRYQMDHAPRPKKVYDYGSVCHALVLGEGVQFEVLDPAVVGLTADGKQSQKPTATTMWKQADAQARVAGKVPIAKWDMDQAELMAAEVCKHPLASALLAEGYAELSGWWTDQETGVRCRLRPDYLPIDKPRRRPLIVDYKTTDDANPEKFAKSMRDYGYHCQGDWYLDGFFVITGIDADFVLIAQSKKAPYSVSVHYIDPEDMVRAQGQNRRARRLYAQCRETGRWPGYEELNILSLPTWLRKEIDLANAIEENTMEGEIH